MSVTRSLSSLVSKAAKSRFFPVSKEVSISTRPMKLGRMKVQTSRMNIFSDELSGCMGRVQTEVLFPIVRAVFP